MDLPSAALMLKANFSGVIAYEFSIDVVANTVFGSHEAKNRDLVWCLMEINSWKKHIILRNKVMNNRGSLKRIVIEKVSVLVNIDFS